MTLRHLEGELICIENVLNSVSYDFTAKYMAVCELRDFFRKNPEIIRSRTLATLKGLFKNPVISRQTQAYFLFKEAAEALCSILCHAMDAHAMNASLATRATTHIVDLLGTTNGHPQRAAAEALGKIDPKAAAKALAKALTESPHPEVRAAAALALGRCGEEVVPALKKAVHDKNPRVSEAARKTLQRLESK